MRGGESVLLENMTPEGRLLFQLPGITPPSPRRSPRSGLCHILEHEDNEMMRSLEVLPAP
ncbi:MAG TPA: hypothetical protein VI072_17580 [Polyangiaceae bacterium]